MTHQQDAQQAAVREQQRRLSRKGRQQSPRKPPPSPAPLYTHPEPRNEQERQLRAQAERRERALLWTDDRPFSIWKE